MAMAAAPLCCCCAQGLWYAPTIGAPRIGSKKNSSKHRNRLLGVAVETTRSNWLNLGQKQMNGARWRCMADSSDKEDTDPTTSSTTPQCCDDKAEEDELKSAPKAAKETVTRSAQEFQQIGPTKQINQFIALGSVLVAVGLFASARLGGGVPGLSQLTLQAVPYEEALANGRPTVVEFYADWCEVCREMAKDVYRVEEEYRDRINFVMLNVDNPKWEPELDEFGVEGIPHFAFLDRKGNEEGNIVGRLPPKFLRENVMAMARGDATVPHSSIVGAFSSADSRQAPPITSPRSHS